MCTIYPNVLCLHRHLLRILHVDVLLHATQRKQAVLVCGQYTLYVSQVCTGFSDLLTTRGYTLEHTCGLVESTDEGVVHHGDIIIIIATTSSSSAYFDGQVSICMQPLC